MKVYVTIKSDRADQEIARASQENDEARIRRLSHDFDRVARAIRDWATLVRGEIIGETGGVVRLKLPPNVIPDLSREISRYEDSTDIPASAGIGMSLTDADKALAVAQKRGGNRVVMWDDQMQEELSGKSETEEGSDTFDQNKTDDQLLSDLEKNAKDSYAGEHKPAGPDFGAPLHNLVGIYPEDVYSSDATRLYTSGYKDDSKIFDLARRLRGKPGSLVTIYRAVPADLVPQKKLENLEKQKAYILKHGRVPPGVTTSLSSSKYYDKIWDEVESLRSAEPKKVDINPGDWVTLSRNYAADHGKAHLNGDYVILSRKVRADELFTEGESIQEWGYWPKKQLDKYEIDKELKKNEASNDPRNMIAQALMRIKEQAPVLEQLKEARPEAYEAVLGIIQAMVEMGKALLQPDQPQQLEKAEIRVCECEAYRFPHRAGGGKCDEKGIPLEKVGMLPGQKRKTLRPGLVYPVHQQLENTLKVQHGTGPILQDGTTQGSGQTGWIQGSAGLILSANDHGNPHAISSRNPSGE